MKFEKYNIKVVVRSHVYKLDSNNDPTLCAHFYTLDKICDKWVHVRSFDNIAKFKDDDGTQTMKR